MAAAPHDPDVLRGAMSVAGLLARGVDVISQPGMMEAIVRVGAVPPLPGPSRMELVRDRRTVVEGGGVMRYEVNGIGIEVQDEGSGPPVLLLHGWPDSHRLWRHQVAALDRGRLPLRRPRPARVR